MLVSYVIITHNRRDVLAANLQKLTGTLPARSLQERPKDHDHELIIVDNASSDGTAQAIAETFPEARVIQLDENLGCAARNRGVEAATGDWIVFLDDDSRPRPGAIEMAIPYLQAHPRVAVLGGPVWLPDGRQDWGALPRVPPGCGLMVRRSVFLEAGGFDPDLFMAAEEYDLVFRILRAGYEATRLETVGFDHDKTPSSRDRHRVMALDLRNNLYIAWRYLPRPLRRRFMGDWLRRYTALLRGAGAGHLARDAVTEARGMIARRRPSTDQILPASIVENLFGLEDQTRRVRDWARRYEIRRVVIGDHSKTLWTTWQACSRAGLQVVAVSDDHGAYRGLSYRGVPVLPDHQAQQRAAEGVVLSNLNPARVAPRAAGLRDRYDVPVLAFFCDRRGPDAPPSGDETPIRGGRGIEAAG